MTGTTPWRSLVLCLLAAQLRVCGDVAGNLIKNPGFEEVEKDKRGACAPKHWRMVSSTPRVIEARLDTVTVRGGKRSVRLFRYDTGFGKPFAYVSQKAEVRETARDYEFKGWFKCKSLRAPGHEIGTIVVSLICLDAAGQDVGKRVMQHRVATMDWRELSQRFPVPRETAVVRVMLHWPYGHEEGGRLWTDDLSLAPAE